MSDDTKKNSGTADGSEPTITAPTTKEGEDAAPVRSSHWKMPPLR